MRFLADENFPRAAIVALSLSGHEIVSVAETASGSADVDVLAWGLRDGLVILILDKDFGALAQTISFQAEPFGIILFRISSSRPSDLGQRIASVVDSRDDWIGHFAVVEPDRIRLRVLGPRGQSSFVRAQSPP